MGLPSIEILDIVFLVYYVPALLVSAFVGYKHGFDRQAGWLNLILLCLFRIVGSALGIAVIYSPSTGLAAASITLSSLGTVSLIGALLGLVSRANQHMTDGALPARATRFLQLGTILAIVLAIVGGIKASSSDPSNQETGHHLTEGAICILIVMYIITALICLYTYTRRELVIDAEKRLLYVSLLSLPFVLVRLIYSVLSAFLWQNSNFSSASNTTTAVVIRGIMGAAMEFIVVALFLWAGLTVSQSVERRSQRVARAHQTTEYQSVNGYDSRYELTSNVESQKPVQMGTYR